MTARFLPARLTVVAALACSTLLAVESPPESNFHIESCSSGVDYPTKGDESVKASWEELTYHVRIVHPSVVEGPHFSVPFFWVGPKEKQDEFSLPSLISLPPHVDGLHWNSANVAYFFAEVKKDEPHPLKGFFLVNGADNADSGASGLLFLFDGKNSSAWTWTYSLPPDEKRSRYQITGATDGKTAPTDLVKRLDQVLKHAEREAGGWTGP